MKRKELKRAILERKKLNKGNSERSNLKRTILKRINLERGNSETDPDGQPGLVNQVQSTRSGPNAELGRGVGRFSYIPDCAW